jgi:aminomethyltransferase
LRGHARLYAAETATEQIGVITSGGFGPSFGGPVAMGYVPSEFSAAGTLLFADLRGNRVGVDVRAMPFVAHRFKR